MFPHCFKGGALTLDSKYFCRRYPLLFRQNKPAERGSFQGGQASIACVLTEAEDAQRRLELETRKQKLVEKFSEEIEHACSKVSQLYTMEPI